MGVIRQKSYLSLQNLILGANCEFTIWSYEAGLAFPAGIEVKYDAC